MIIGREKEVDILQKCYESAKSEFVVMYGRRRVGKTFLIKELFGSNFCFYTTGILNESLAMQLAAWNNDMKYYGGNGLESAS